jgi:hypothetical protein
MRPFDTAGRGFNVWAYCPQHRCNVYVTMLTLGGEVRHGRVIEAALACRWTKR